MNLRDINKRYIDDVLDYYIKEMYSWQYTEYEYGSERDIEVMLNKRLEELNKKDFVRDWKVNVNLRTKAEIRAAKLEGLLRYYIKCRIDRCVASGYRKKNL